MFKSFGIAMVISIFFLTSVALASGVEPQPNKKGSATALDILGSDLTSKKMLLMAEGMALIEKDGQAFWPLYKEFLKKRKKANDELVAIVTDYAKNPQGFTNEKVKKTFKRIFVTDRNILALEEEYFNKISKSCSPLIAARFLQIEDIINTTIEFQVLSKLPLFTNIVEADKKAGSGTK